MKDKSPAAPRVPEKLYAIIGHPLGHSLSPLLHNWALELAGIPAVYMAVPTPPEGLEAFMTAMRALPISGASVTIPHKQAVMSRLDGVSDRARAIGAVNTLYWRDGALLGENTDITGFIRPLEGLRTPPTSALVLGAGGAARAVLAGLRELGVSDIAITNRNPGKAMTLALEFAAQALPWNERARTQAQLLVNTTPLGMKGQRQDESPWPEGACLAPSQIAYDLVYNPLETAFLRQAAGHGCATIDGLSMFIHQAAEQFRLWTGLDFPLDKARLLLSAAL